MFCRLFFVFLSHHFIFRTCNLKNFSIRFFFDSSRLQINICIFIFISERFYYVSIIRIRIKSSFFWCIKSHILFSNFLKSIHILIIFNTMIFSMVFIFYCYNYLFYFTFKSVVFVWIIRCITNSSCSLIHLFFIF